MEKVQITFEEIPSFLSLMMEKLEAVVERLDNLDQFKQNSKKDVWFSVKTLSEYIPNHPAAPTIYGWTHNKLIPYHKKGKALLFLKSEIDKWLDSEKQYSNMELREEAVAEIQRRNEEAVRRKYFGQ